MFTIKDIERQKNAFKRFYMSKKKEFEFNQVQMNLLIKTKRKLNQFYLIMEEHLNTNKPIYQIIKDKKIMSKSSFFEFQNRIKKHFYSKDKNLILFESTRPKRTRTFYSLLQQQVMVNGFYDYDNWHNKSSFWVNLKNKYPHLSLRIFIKYINNDYRAEIKPLKIAKIKHPKRKYSVDLGNIQMDVKIFDKYENPKHLKLYLLDFIDEQSKLVYGEFIDKQSAENILNVVKRAKEFYLKNGIRIKRIRTDNAMVFKKTNFVHSGIFQNYLKEQNIKHEFTPLNEPQCNGCIERFHRTVSVEFCKKIKHKLISFFDLKNIWNSYLNFYNNERNHYYEYLKNNKFHERFLTPKNMVKQTLYLLSNK